MTSRNIAIGILALFALIIIGGSCNHAIAKRHELRMTCLESYTPKECALMDCVIDAPSSNTIYCKDALKED